MIQLQVHHLVHLILQQATQKVDTRARGRAVALKIENTLLVKVGS